MGLCEAHLKFRELTGNQVLPCCSLRHISRIFYFWLIPLSDRHQNQLLSTVQTATIWTRRGILNLLFARPLSFLIGSLIASSYQCIDHHLASVSSPSHLCSSCSWGLFLKSRHFWTSWDLQLCLHDPAVLDQLPSSHPAPPLFVLFPRSALFHHYSELLASANWCFLQLLAAHLYSRLLTHTGLLWFLFSTHSFTSAVYSRGVHSSASHIL